MLNNNDLHSQLIKLGDMMGDGLHLEPGGGWISREYKKILRQLEPELFHKRDYTTRNLSVQRFCDKHKCSVCSGTLEQTRSGSLRVICVTCKTKFQLKKK